MGANLGRPGWRKVGRTRPSAAARCELALEQRGHRVVDRQGGQARLDDGGVVGREVAVAQHRVGVGLDEQRRIYQTAIEERYRFFSYGDAMFIE